METADQHDSHTQENDEQTKKVMQALKHADATFRSARRDSPGRTNISFASQRPTKSKKSSTSSKRADNDRVEREQRQQYHSKQNYQNCKRRQLMTPFKFLVQSGCIADPVWEFWWRGIHLASPQDTDPKDHHMDKVRGHVCFCSLLFVLVLGASARVSLCPRLLLFFPILPSSLNPSVFSLSFSPSRIVEMFPAAPLFGTTWSLHHIGSERTVTPPTPAYLRL